MALSAAACAVGLLAGWIELSTLERLVDRPGAASMLVYVLVVFAAELFWLPRLWGLLVGGLVFGPWLGCALSCAANMMSASFCFALARGGGRDWVRTRLRRHPRARAATELLAQRRGALTVGLLRAGPIHYTAVSYAAGLAGVRWRPYLLGTFVGLWPGTVAYNFLGDAARDPGHPAFIAAVAAVVAVVVLGAVVVRRVWRKPGAP